jgi:hypothetical protein
MCQRNAMIPGARGKLRSYNGVRPACLQTRLAGARSREQGANLEPLTIALCISIGTGVPWLMAIHSDYGARQLFWNSLVGLAVALLCALAFERLSPLYSILALISAGPVVVLLAINLAQAVRRAIARRMTPPPG